MENDIVNTLYGCQTERHRCCGYCKRKGKYLTTKQLKKHECLGKQCPHLDKLPHPFWVQREKKLQAKKERKVTQYLNTPSFINDVNTELSKALGFDTSDLMPHAI